MNGVETVDLQLDKCTATAALSAEARQVHVYVLRTFAATGRAPSRADLRRVAADRGCDPAMVLTELAERDVVAVDARGELRAAYPFSPTPTAIQVTWDGGPTVYAMCAVDALGMSAMLDRPVTITATEPDTGNAVTVHVDGDRADWTPASAVVFAGATDDSCCPSVDRTCGAINFFTTSEAAGDWASRHPDVSGAVLDRATALAQAVAEFGAML
ncbi:MAG: hypothetical protein GEV07_18010 [Streptosporangiales bacterium]|nr:hypothetical protein [Streptosporangiales bacterium]